MSECPKIRSCLLCDRVIVEHGTGKATLVGVFSNINMTSLPGQYPRQFHVFLEVTNIVDGQQPMTIQIFGPSDPDSPVGTEILRIEGQLNAKDPNAVAAINFELDGLPIGLPGRHRIQFSSGGRPCGDTWFMVTLKEAPQ